MSDTVADGDSLREMLCQIQVQMCLSEGDVMSDTGADGVSLRQILSQIWVQMGD